MNERKASKLKYNKKNTMNQEWTDARTYCKEFSTFSVEERKGRKNQTSSKKKSIIFGDGDGVVWWTSKQANQPDQTKETNKSRMKLNRVFL